MQLTPSRPARALWIEIDAFPSSTLTKVSRPARALWIEMMKVSAGELCAEMSRPARALWIEI